jgi:hypothetical protein
MPKPGFFILHDAAVPDLPAGEYTIHVEQRIDVSGEDQDPIPGRDTHLLITAPRFILPPDQILSTYPPNQAEGAFSSRLPQIVLRRRTLPWERPHSGKLDTTPWLALVVIADGEGELRPNVPVAQCVTPGVTLSGPRDAETGTALRVTETVVQKVFPGRDEVGLLAHVREVDISDTELILGDDDGWMAVIVANRLPQPGVRYRACLISLEGQIDRLPDGAAIAIAPQFEVTSVYPEIRAQIHQGDLHSVLKASGSGVGQIALRSKGAISHTQSDAWSESKSAQAGEIVHAGYALEGKIAALQVGGLELEAMHPTETILTFPVLAHWTFSCTESGDFQSHMQKLHVGLQGTLMDAVPPAPGKTLPPPTRRPPSVLATGHVVLEAVTREGEPEQVWYRGPLSLRPGTRNKPDVAGVVPLLHVADQARRLGSDGREDVSLAVAFEIGRLLALAEPAVVAALLRWRRNAFVVSRAVDLLGHDPQILGFLKEGLPQLPIRLGLDLLTKLGADRSRLIGPPRPVFDPGHPFVQLDDLANTIARGFGLQIDKPEAGPPDVSILTDVNEILRDGFKGLLHVETALDRERMQLAKFADEFDRGAKP